MKYLRLILGALLCYSFSAQADLLLDKNVIEFAATDVPRKDIILTNAGDAALFIDVETARIVGPGTNQEQRLSFTDPRKLGLLTSPSRLKLGPKETRRLRLTLLKRAEEKDEIFRVKITPQPEAFNEEKKGIRVMIAYDALVIARPPNAAAELEADRQGTQLYITNKGNSNVLYYNGEQCDANNENCKAIAGKRLYAGTNNLIELPYQDTPVKFLTSSHATETRVVVH